MADAGPLETMTNIETLETSRQEIANDAHRIWWWSLACARSHFATANLWRVVHFTIGSAAATLAAVTGISALADLVGTTGAGLGSLIAAALGGLATVLSGEQRAKAATDAANEYVEVRDEARQFLRIDLRTLDYEIARSRLEELTRKYHRANRAAEPPLRIARWRARRLLARDQKLGEEGKNVELPSSLQKVDR
jgi:hypothetical protein